MNFTYKFSTPKSNENSAKNLAQYVKKLEDIMINVAIRQTTTTSTPKNS